jgi:hypothetical protein
MSRKAELVSRRGVVLIAALLVLLALEAAAVGLLFLGTQQVLSARAHERALRTRLAAEDAALIRAEQLVDEPPYAGELPPPARDTAFAGAYRLETSVAASGPSWLLSHAYARDPAGGGATASLLLQRRDPLRFAALFFGSAAISSAGAEGEPAGFAPLASVDPDTAAADAAAELLGLPGSVVRGDLLPGAFAAGDVCLTDRPDNWGAVLAGDPCYRHVPLIRIDDELRLAGGSGRAVLVVTGRLMIGTGTALVGAVLIAGEVVIADGATLSGGIALLPGGSLVVNGTFEPDSSALRALLHDAVALRRPVAAKRFWLPGF